MIFGCFLTQSAHGQVLPLHGADLPGAPSATTCGEAIRAAELRHHLPPGLLFAIGQVESGRPDAATGRLEPWPWTTQAEDKSGYFDNKLQAVQWTREAVARGVNSIDVGCMQVNLFYHPDAFATLDDAFDPRRNADYAARFLLQLYAMTGDWRTATGYYHSQTPVLAEPYADLVTRRMGEAGSTWKSPPKPPSLATRLAEAWRVTRPADVPAPPEATGNDWSALLRLVRRPAARPHLPMQARAGSLSLSQMTSIH
jgi:hypothetical protein